MNTPAHTTLTRACLALVGLVLGCAALFGGAGEAHGEVVGTEDFTSWEQVYNKEPQRESVSNAPNYDFYVNGSKPIGIKCGLGLLKDGEIIGHMNNDWGEYGDGLFGSVNVDPDKTNPIDNLNALVLKLTDFTPPGVSPGGG